MSENYIWGNLSKAVNDPTLIDQAIETAVTAHNDDPEAHLGADQALQSHRAAEIIDHLAESVVNDKIKANARTYLAIVDPLGGGDYTTIEDACDYAFTKGSGSIYIKKGTYTPDRDLKLKYGIDLYGEGPNETNIDLSSTTYKHLNISGDGVLFVQTIPAVYYTENEQGMLFDAAPNIEAQDFELVYMRVFGQDGIIGTNPNDPYIYAWDIAPETGSETDVYIEPTITCDTSSDVIHVNGWKFCEGLENGAGLWIASSEGNIGYFEEYLGNGDIKLTANSELTAAHSQQIYFEGPSGRMTVIQGLSFACGGNSYIFKVAGAKGRLYVRDAAFSDCAGIFSTDTNYNTLDGQNCTIEDTIIDFPSGACNMDISGATMRNCTFNFGSSAYPGPLGGPQSYFENCNFTGDPGGTTNRLAYVLHDSRFNGCIFTYMNNGDIVNNGSYAPTMPNVYVSFVGCTFFTGLASPCVFSGNNIIVSGCRFQCSTANVGLKSTTRYSVFVGNQGRGTLLAQPVNCIVTGNGLWPSMT